MKIADVKIGDHIVAWYRQPRSPGSEIATEEYRFVLVGPSGGNPWRRDTVACGNARGITTSKAGKWSAHLRVDAGDRLPRGMAGPILDALEAALTTSHESLTA